MMKSRKFVSNIMVALSIILYMWLGVSYGEIVIKNTSPNPEYSKNNIIVNLVTAADRDLK